MLRLSRTSGTVASLIRRQGPAGRRPFATESKEPPLIPPPPPDEGMNRIRLVIIGMGLAFGAYVVVQPPNDYAALGCDPQNPLGRSS